MTSLSLFNNGQMGLNLLMRVRVKGIGTCRSNMIIYHWYSFTCIREKKHHALAFSTSSALSACEGNESKPNMIMMQFPSKISPHLKIGQNIGSQRARSSCQQSNWDLSKQARNSCQESNWDEYLRVACLPWLCPRVWRPATRQLSPRVVRVVVCKCRAAPQIESDRAVWDDRVMWLAPSLPLIIIPRPGECSAAIIRWGGRGGA